MALLSSAMSGVLKRQCLVSSLLYGSQINTPCSPFPTGKVPGEPDNRYQASKDNFLYQSLDKRVCAS
jgi:hypothetical protein